MKAQKNEKVLKMAHFPYILVYHLQNDADPDPAYYFDADANPDPTVQFDDSAPDPQH
jgi:hypothetical protein